MVRESFPYAGSTVIMQFIYDASGRPFGLLYSTNGGASFDQYYYAVNTQGDVDGIFLTKKDSNGVQRISWMGRYTYDAWGNVLSVTNVSGDAVTSPNHFMNRNPLRYRGYYYDVETGFYYLQSRYYDPANHRFINADSYTSTGQGFLGYNMFAYCLNSPAVMTDVTGMFSLPLISSMDLPAMFFGLSLVTFGETSEDNPYVFTDNDGCGRKLGAAFASSYAMMKLITTNIARASWEKDSYTFNETFDPYPYDYHGPDEELSLSVGEANISITISRTGDNKYYVSYTVSDSYTFEDWKTSKSGLFAKVSNNAGYILARIGTVKPYYWTYTGSFYYFSPAPYTDRKSENVLKH